MSEPLRIAYIAAGAGGMYCGSCIHDNTLAAALGRLGHDVALLPTYTPVRTDETSVSGRRIFYGALNVYLQQKSALFRHTPWLVDRLFDRPRLLAWLATRFSGSTDPRELGELTLAMLQGEEGPQKKELDKLVAWLRDTYKPDVVQITNSMLLGLVRRFKAELGVPVLVAVQGEDLFLDELPEPFRTEARAEASRRAAEADGFVAPSHFYAREMAARLGVPIEKMHVVPLGIRLRAHDEKDGGEIGANGSAGEDGSNRNGPTIGYLARICPEKGLHQLLDAFRHLTELPGGADARLRIAGYLGPKDEPYLREQMERVRSWGLEDRVEHIGEVDLAGKVRFLRSLDVFSVPTVYREPKGLPILEAMANGVPVVQPRHGSFPEMIEETGGGILVAPDSPLEIARGISDLLVDADRRRELGEAGRSAVHRIRDDETMARATIAVYRKALLTKGASHA